VPEDFSYWPGSEYYYKVELDPSEQRVRSFLEQSMGLPECSIDKINIHVKNSIQYQGCIGHDIASSGVIVTFSIEFQSEFGTIL
jgi:hypothetical protein